MTGPSFVVTDDLDFDVTRLFNQLLHVHAVIAECGFRLLSGGVPCTFQIFFFPDRAHSFAPTSGRRLEHDRVTDLLSCFFGLGQAFKDAIRSGNGRYAGFLHRCLGRCLVAHHVDHFFRRSDELDTVLLANLRETGVL